MRDTGDNVSSNADMEDPDDMDGGNRPAGGHKAVDPGKGGAGCRPDEGAGYGRSRELRQNLTVGRDFRMGWSFGVLSLM
jgi:hypothetical protein